MPPSLPAPIDPVDGARPLLRPNEDMPGPVECGALRESDGIKPVPGPGGCCGPLDESAGDSSLAEQGPTRGEGRKP